MNFFLLLEKKKRKHTNYKGTLDLIPAKHRIVSKSDKTDLGTILGRSSKVTVYETQKKLTVQKDPTDKNVQKLLVLSKNRMDPNTVNKVINAINKARNNFHKKHCIILTENLFVVNRSSCKEKIYSKTTET